MSRIWVAFIFLLSVNSFAAAPLRIDSKVWETTVVNLKKSLSETRNSSDIYYRKHIDWVPSTVSFQSSAVKLKMLNHIMGAPKESILESFTNKTSIKRVKSFMKKHEEAFKQNQKKSGVPSGIVAGILYIETAYNAPYVKYYPALDTLMSLAALHDEDFRNHALPKLRELAKVYKPEGKWKEAKAWEDRSKKIGDRWFNETKEFLNLTVQFRWNKDFMLDVESSWAGAIGFSQFLPSTARDQIKDSRFDLWDWSNSIEFTSNELHSKGWEKDPTEALMKYNKVRWYGQTVKKINDLVEAWWKNISKSKADRVAKK